MTREYICRFLPSLLDVGPTSIRAAATTVTSVAHNRFGNGLCGVLGEWFPASVTAGMRSRSGSGAEVVEPRQKTGVQRGPRTNDASMFRFLTIVDEQIALPRG